MTRADYPPAGERVNPDRPREFAQSGREVDFFLPVICTDRGQHKRVRLTTVIRELDGGLHMSRAFEAFAPPMGKEAEPETLVSRNAYTFVCPRCNRSPQVGRDRWWYLVREYARVAAPWVDISKLG